MPTAAEQIAEESLRFNFEYNSLQINRAIKTISREFPDLRSGDLRTLYQLNRLAANLLTDPSFINSIANFSLTFGAETEAVIIVNGIPFQDFPTVQTQKFQEALDKQIEAFCFSQDIRKPGFIPIDFDALSGWPSLTVLATKEIITVKVANFLEVKSQTLSFNDIEDYVFNNNSQFNDTERQCLTIYRYVVLKNLNEIIIDNIEQILEDILLISGSALFSNIGTNLGINLNINNRKILEASVTAEQFVLNLASSASGTFGAIFPQLRQSRRL